MFCRALRGDDVSLRITHCGVCYADVLWTRNKIGDSKYPLVPGWALLLNLKYIVYRQSHTNWIHFRSLCSSILPLNHANACNISGTRLLALSQQLVLALKTWGPAIMLELGLTWIHAGNACIAMNSVKSFAPKEQPLRSMAWIQMARSQRGVIPATSWCMRGKSCSMSSVYRSVVSPWTQVICWVSFHRYCYKIPDGYPPDRAAPLLCAGITVYSPMMRHRMNQPGKSLGVIGLGGLGHLAVKFGKAFGLQVTVFSTSVSKKGEALDLLGADKFVISSNKQEMEVQNQQTKSQANMDPSTAFWFILFAVFGEEFGLHNRYCFWSSPFRSLHVAPKGSWGPGPCRIPRRSAIESSKPSSWSSSSSSSVSSLHWPCSCMLIELLRLLQVPKPYLGVPQGAPKRHKKC